MGVCVSIHWHRWRSLFVLVFLLHEFWEIVCQLMGNIAGDYILSQDTLVPPLPQFNTHFEKIYVEDCYVDFINLIPWRDINSVVPFDELSRELEPEIVIELAA
ncbi:hypothetical protein C5167_016412 [Papaver somniferum]|nr:hypothetical protein C5167_016412 [Papaver somniferum]